MKLKPYYLLFILLFWIANTYSQYSVSGYYITQKSDTVIAQIKIRKGVFGQTTNDFIKEVEVIDSINNPKVFTPYDIKGYGFLYKGTRYRFVSKPVKNGSYKFLEPIFIGTNSSLYHYSINTSGSVNALASQRVFYTFEKADNTYLFLTNILNKKFKIQLKDFYKDNLEVQNLIDTKLKYWLDLQKDLKEILYIANKQ